MSYWAPQWRIQLVNQTESFSISPEMLIVSQFERSEQKHCNTHSDRFLGFLTEKDQASLTSTAEER